MLTMVLAVAVAPAVICGLLLLAIGTLKSGNDSRLAWAIPVAVAMGVTIAELFGGTQHFPPLEASDWFIPIAVAIAAIAFVRDKLSGWPLRFVLGAVVVGVICKPLFGGAWTIGQGLGWCTVMVAVIAVAWLSVDRAAAVAPGFGLPAALVILASGAAVTVALAGSAHYGQDIGAVASALGPVAVLGILRRDALLTRAAWAPFLVVASVVVAAFAFVDVPVIACILLMLGFFALPLVDVPAFASRPRWQREALRLGVAVVAVVIAVIIALPQTSADGY